MRVTTNEKFIQRKARLGKYCSLAGLAVLTGGMVINFSMPEYFELSLLCLVVGFAVASIGAYNVSRWVKPPRGDEVLVKSLKGLSNKYRLYNYTVSVPHVLLAPFGLYVLHCKKQDGDVVYRGNDKWRQRVDIKRRLKLFFGAEQPVGNPTNELASDMGSLANLLGQLLPDEDIVVNGAIVFTNDEVNLTREADDTAPILLPKEIKKFLIEEQKRKEAWYTDKMNLVAQTLDEQGAK